MFWATDLLPHEINFNDIDLPKQNVIYYIGTPVPSNNYAIFRKICNNKGIKWIISNPWHRPLSFEDNKKLMQLSLLAPDFKPLGPQKDIDKYGILNGKNHLATGWLPCRILKAISYGQVGITDSPHIKKILKEHVLFSSNMQELFNKAILNRNNKNMIKNAMEYVKENHTYVNRAIALIKALCQ